MGKFVWLFLIFNLLLTLRSYASDYAYRGDLNIDSIIREKVKEIDREKNGDVKVMYNLLRQASKNDYNSFNDIVVNYPSIKEFFSDALYDAGIIEIEIIDEKGVAYIEFALMKLEDRLIYQGREPDPDKLAMLIDLNSSGGCISCMDLGVVIMQYIIN
ncbi:MAG: hypothetical protein P9L98_03960 [Candidatus Kaelpia imicola]|nr:hypothetical protein [Candidatus Kaelpia imicola]